MAGVRFTSRGEREAAGVGVKGRSSFSGIVRDFATAVVSIAVVAFLVAYALTKPSVTLAAAANVEEHAGNDAVVAGRVLDSDGDGLAGAEVRAARPGGTALSARSGERGYFRLELPGACAVYDVDFAAAAHGSQLRKSLRQRLCPGDALEVDARIVADGQLLWMPTR